ncbi:MAG TPA: Na+/H+ antiporter NhaA [Ilumatobacteraceae bacterium]|nr:Na+/H+ antiporter NhaA [Ilumatobacteraceae bacterium]
MSHGRRRAHPSIVRVLSPLRDFLATEASGAILLGTAAIAALVWANSPVAASYDSLWHSHLAITLAGHTLDLDLRHWVNDGLMTVFFLVVGLEIKRELANGHLSSRRAALLPAAAALGGMLVPALVYLAIAGGTAPRGWAIPIATDIALAIGVVALAGSRIPGSVRAFLLGLAIVDDIGAIVVIALVYSTGVAFGWLAAAIMALALTAALKGFGVYWTWIYVVIGCFAWFGLYQAGVHPTIAGVAMGLLAPSTARLSPEMVDIEQLADVSDAPAARETSDLARGSVSVVEWLQHVLHPWTSYVIVPIFALANIGIEISADGLRDAAKSAVTWGVFFGLVIGKPLGVFVASRTTVRMGAADMPAESTSRQLIGIGTAAGIGFTVAIFVTELAFNDPARQNDAKLAILAASLVAAAVAGIILSTVPKPRR